MTEEIDNRTIEELLNIKPVYNSMSGTLDEKHIFPEEAYVDYYIDYYSLLDFVS